MENDIMENDIRIVKNICKHLNNDYTKSELIDIAIRSGLLKEEADYLNKSELCEFLITQLQIHIPTDPEYDQKGLIPFGLKDRPTDYRTIVPRDIMNIVDSYINPPPHVILGWLKNKYPDQYPDIEERIKYRPRHINITNITNLTFIMRKDKPYFGLSPLGIRSMEVVNGRITNSSDLLKILPLLEKVEGGEKQIKYFIKDATILDNNRLIIPWKKKNLCIELMENSIDLPVIWVFYWI